MKRVHLKELKIVKAKSKQPAMEKIDYFKMSLVEEEEASVVQGDPSPGEPGLG